jgi:hypothetical protein
MDEVTQQNTPLVEGAVAASEAMQDQSIKLSQVSSVFKLDGSQSVMTVASANPFALTRLRKSVSAMHRRAAVDDHFGLAQQPFHRIDRAFPGRTRMWRRQFGRDPG